MHTKQISGLILGITLGFIPIQSTLGYGSATEADLLFLPPYCKATRLYDPGLKSREYQYWYERLGPNLESMHHHCQGLIYLRKLRQMPKGQPERQHLIKLTLGEFNFLLRRSEATLQAFPLWAEFLTIRGSAAILAEDWALAVQSYEKARTVKPDYWPAYLDWARQLDSLKLRQQARELIQQGLRIDPSVVPMREAFARYGGKPQDLPVPVAAPAASAPVASEAAPAASTPAASEAASAAPAAASAASE